MTPMNHTIESNKSLTKSINQKYQEFERIELECKNIMKHIDKRDVKIKSVEEMVYKLEIDHGNTKNILIKSLNEDIVKIKEKYSSECNSIRKKLDDNITSINENVTNVD